MLDFGQPELPGTFVVLQGVPGDGMRNTIHSFPKYPAKIDDNTAEQRCNDESTTDLQEISSLPVTSTSEGYPNEKAATGTALYACSTLPASQATSGSVLQNSGIFPLGCWSPPSASEALSATNGSIHSIQSASTGNDFLSGGSHKSQKDEQNFGCSKSHRFDGLPAKLRCSTPNYAEELALNEWERLCRDEEEGQWLEWNESSEPRPQLRVNENRWWTENGRLIVFERVPSLDTLSTTPTVGILSPGTVVLGTEMLTIGPSTGRCRVYRPSDATELLRIEAPIQGYIVFSVNRYRFLFPGMLSALLSDRQWLWRVSCPVGAFVRKGLELSTQHITTVPYGSLVHVKRKAINAMGLSRLQVEVFVPPESESKDPEMVLGWCSEYLNPLSGQRGKIAQPLPLPVPAVYCVMLKEGAIIRDGVELSSQEIGHAPEGSLVSITSRAFTEHPTEDCVERLRIAGNGGWISRKLNNPPPLDLVIVKLIELDGEFEPNAPWAFHFSQLRKMQESHQEPTCCGTQVNEFTALPILSPLNPPERSRKGSLTSSRLKKPPLSTYAKIPNRQSALEDQCLVCLADFRTSTIVHGETGHIACCLVCARILKAQGSPCPICRQPIELVVQHFWA